MIISGFCSANFPVVKNVSLRLCFWAASRILSAEFIPDPQSKVKIICFLFGFPREISLLGGMNNAEVVVTSISVVVAGGGVAKSSGDFVSAGALTFGIDLGVSMPQQKTAARIITAVKKKAGIK